MHAAASQGDGGTCSCADGRCAACPLPRNSLRRLRQRSLREAWARLEPAARQLAREAGLAAGPTLDDWVWANSVFW